MMQSQKSKRRSRKAKPAAETLEARSLLTGGAGNTFALESVTIPSAGGTVNVPFTIDPRNFTLPKGKFALGVDVAPASGSSVKPLISEIISPTGNPVSQAFHSIYNPHLTHLQVASGKGTSAVLTPIVMIPGQPNTPVTYQVQITAEGGTSGSVLVDFYLPGDVNGTGTVTKQDVQEVRSLVGTRANSKRYNFQADTNRDGRIGLIDVAYTRQNLGVSTNLLPFVSAQLNPATDTSYPSRLTTDQIIQFNGQASPYATVSFTSPNNSFSAITTNTNAQGNYTVNIPLVQGMNYFNVGSTDLFGQHITGSVTPVQYVDPKVVNFQDSLTTTPPASTSTTSTTPPASTSNSLTPPSSLTGHPKLIALWQQREMKIIKASSGGSAGKKG